MDRRPGIDQLSDTGEPVNAGDADRRAANEEMDVPDDQDTRDLDSEVPETNAKGDGEAPDRSAAPEEAVDEEAGGEDGTQEAQPEGDTASEDEGDTASEPKGDAVAEDEADAASEDGADTVSEDEPPEEPASPLDGAKEIAELEADRDRLRDQHLRLAADFENFRRRTEERLRQRWSRAQADLVRRMLEPLDDLRRVTALEPETTASVDAIVEGVDLVEKKFFRALEEAGVEVVDPEGEEFDPNTMEAMMRVPAESEEDDDTVAGVFQRGYTLKGMLIRPARVSVFKAD